MPTLTENTVVVNPETGQPVLLAATGELPEWAEGLVGDHLLEGRTKRTPTRSAQDSDEVAKLKARIAQLEAAQAAEPPAEVPPMRGPGSSAGDWRAYARSVGVEVDEDASREDVVSALTAAGKPTTR